MKIRQIKDIRRLFVPTSNRKTSKPKKRGLILALSTLLFVGGIWGQAEDVSANAPDTYIQNQLSRAFNNNSTTYTYRGYFSIHGGASNVNHRWGRFDDPTPNITVQNSLYHPTKYNYESYRYIEMYRPLADWGFAPGITARWDGGLYRVASGVGAGWQRSARVDYTRQKTAPETRGVTIAGHDYVNGNEYWVRQGNSVQARVHGRQNFNGTKWRWNDYVDRNFLRMMNSTRNIRSHMTYTGAYSNDVTHSDLTLSRHSHSQANSARDLYTTFNVRGNTHGVRYEFETYARSANGRNDGYLATGKFLNVDGVAPTRGTVTLGGARYVNGNDHWVRPGDRVTAQMSATDTDSGVAQTNIRVHGSGNDVRARHRYRDASGTINEFRSDGGDVTVTGGTRIRSSNPMTYRFNVDTKTGIGNKTFNVADYHIDNVGNPVAYADSGLRIRTDATAPTISANPTSSEWGNSNVTVALTHADGQSGIATRQYAWSTSTATPSSWTNYSSAVTQTNPGTWYLHARAVDNVGHVTTERFGPYRIDKTAPSPNSPSILNARYTNGNDHWVRPGESVVIRTSVFDDESRMRNTNIRLHGDGNDNRAEYVWANRPTNVNEYQTTGGFTSIYGGEEENWGWTAMYRFNVRANTNAGNRTFNLQTYFRDNADNNTGWIDSGLRLRTDATAPTISANQASSTWGNGNQTVTLTYADGQSGIATRQYAWSTSTATPSSWTNYSSAVTQSSQGTWYLHARAVDNVGHVTTERFGPYRIDKTAPNGTISQTPTGWTNQNVTLTFNATDTGGSGVRRVRVAGGTWVNGSTTSRTVSSNGTYSFEVEDHAGNTRTVSRTVTNIDTDNPALWITHTPNSWTNGNVTTLIRARDFGPPTGSAGVHRFRFRPQGGTWSSWTNYGAETEGSSVWFEQTRTITSNGTYEAQVEDRAGNVTTSTFTVDWIDRTAPNGTISQSPTGWTNQNVTLTLNATDTGSGVRRVRVAGGTWVDGSTTTRTVTTNGTYSFEIEDHVGNTRTVSRTVTNIDKVLPNASSSQSPTAWTNGNVNITWNASATGSPLRRIRTHNGSTWGAWSDVSGTTSSTVQTVTSNGTYHYQVEDQAGNVRQISHTVTNIDKTLPNASSSQSPTGWTNGNVTITWSATAAGGSPLQRVRTHNGSTWGGWTTISGTSRTQTQVVSSNGTYHFQVQDAAGNVRQITRTVSNIDKGSPAIRSSQSPTAWTNGNVTLTLEARDFGELNNQSTHISGIASIQVRRPDGTTWSDTYGAPSENSTSYYGRTFTATANGTYVVTVTDRAGNTATHNHTVSNIDRTLPTGSTNRQTGWTNGNVWIDVTGRDLDAGLASIRYVSGGNVTGDTSFAYTGTTSSQTARFTATQNGTYTFDITDRAGNVRRVTQEVANIDRALPNMTFTSLNTDWTNASIDIRTTVNDRGDTGETRHISGVERIRMRPQGGSWSAWRTFNNTSERSPNNLTETWTITESGTYEWQLQDRAGNTRTASQTVSNIDHTIPTGSANHMSDWTNGNVWIDVTGRDTTSGLASIRYVSGGNVTGDKSYSFNGTTASQTVRFTATENGTYSFDVTDRAGNTRRVTRTVSNIDRTMPSATTSQNPSGWTNQNVTISLSGQDLNNQGSRISGVDRVRMRPVGASSWTETRTVSDSTEASPSFNTLNFTVSANDRYQFELRDRAGNIRLVEHTVSNIDRTAPHGSTTQTPTAWTNQDIVIRLAGGDTNNQGSRISGVDRVRMRPVGASSWSETRTISDSTENSPTFNPLSFTITENGRYQFELRDRAGNTRMLEHTVTNIDRMPPTTSGSFTPDGWTNQTITITWEARRTGNPGAPLEAYRYDRGNGNWTSWQNATHADAFTVAQQVTENGVYRFDIRDEAGNVARSSVTVSQHDIVAPVGQITARYDRSERDDHIGYTSNDLVNMVDSRRVTVDVTGVEDLGISGVDFVTIEEQKRIGYGGEWMTVNETDYDWPDPYNTTSQTYNIDVAHAQDTRFILTVTDRAGNESSRATSNVVRQSVLQAIDFRITDVVNPQLSEDELAAIRSSDLSEGVVELTAGTNVTFDVTYQLRHLDTVENLSGMIKITTISDDRTHTHEIEVEEDTTGHNQHVTFTKTFTVPQGTPRGSEITIVGNLEAKLANGTVHEISYPSTADLGVIDNHIEEFFRFRIVR